MQIVWEKNNRVKSLVLEGKINAHDVIDKTSTGNFPANAVTVRMHKPNSPKPHITLLIRGRSEKMKNWKGDLVETAMTCRVNVNSAEEGRYKDTMDSNGTLDPELSWLDVHNFVTKVKDTVHG